MRIFLTQAHPVMAFAAVELARVLQRMSGETPQVVLHPRPPAPTAGLWLGLLHDFGLEEHFRGRDRTLDDHVFAQVRVGAGRIAGSNPRSLLLAVYRFLTLAGCRWVRPGPDGEIVPRRALRDLHAWLDEAAACRRRTLCLDEAAGLRNVLDLVDWAPKLGFSGGYLKPRAGSSALGNRNAPAAPTCFTDVPLAPAQAQEDTRTMIAELHRRGLQVQTAGSSCMFETCLSPRTPYLFDPDPIRLARLLHQDIRALRGSGSSLLESCPAQPVFLPHALVMTVVGRTLWNPECNFTELAADYFGAAFGPDGHQVQVFLGALGHLLDLTWLQAGAPPPDLAGRVEKARQVLRHFAEIIEYNYGLSEPAQARSWEYLGWHAQILQCFCGLLQARAENAPDEAVNWWHCLRDFIQENELPLQPVLDVNAFIAAYAHLESGGCGG